MTGLINSRSRKIWDVDLNNKVRIDILNFYTGFRYDADGKEMKRMDHDDEVNGYQELINTANLKGTKRGCGQKVRPRKVKICIY